MASNMPPSTPPDRESKTGPTARRPDTWFGIPVLVFLIAVIGVTVYQLFLLITGPITERTLVASVLLAGAGGALLNSVQSLSVFLGNRVFKPSWVPYYIVKPAIGGALAFAFYAVFRAGLVSSAVAADQLNYYGIVSASLLVGLFSNQAISKFALIADGLFRTVYGSHSMADGTLVPGRPILRLDRYTGFLTYVVSSQSDHRVTVTVRLQKEAPNSERSVAIDIGEGEARGPVTFGIVVHSSTHDVSPPSANLVVRPGQVAESSFTLQAASTAVPLEALIELTNRDRAVALVTVGQEKSPREKSLRANA